MLLTRFFIISHKDTENTGCRIKCLIINIFHILRVSVFSVRNQKTKSATIFSGCLKDIILFLTKFFIVAHGLFSHQDTENTESRFNYLIINIFHIPHVFVRNQKKVERITIILKALFNFFGGCKAHIAHWHEFFFGFSHRACVEMAFDCRNAIHGGTRRQPSVAC